MKISVFYTALVLVLSQFVASAVYAQQSYRIRAGDTLRIEVIEDTSLNRSALVSPDGRISVPLAGHIRAAGRSIEAIQADLTAQLAANFQSTPNVFVAVERLAQRRAAAPRVAEPDPTMEIFVLGEVGSPGKMVVAPDSTVLQVFAQMGGFTRFAATGRVQLRRTNDSGVEDVYSLDYDAIEAGLSNDGMVKLAPGDVIVVPQRWLFE
jgi:polysaccharide export outer membrane protein